MAARVYDAIAARSQRRSTLVYSLDDIRRVILERRLDGYPCDLLMGSDIVIDSGLIIPAELTSFAINGGGRFAFKAQGALAALFTCCGTPCVFGDLSIALNTGAVVTTAFVVDQTASVIDLLTLTTALKDIHIDAAAGVLTNVFALGAGRTLGRVLVNGLGAFSVANLFGPGSNLTSWEWCTLTDVSLTGVGLALVNIGLGPNSPNFIECIFQRIAGNINVDTGSFSTSNLWSVISGDGSGTFITRATTGGKPNTLDNVTRFSTVTLSPDDVQVGISRPGRLVTLDSAGPTLTPSISTTLYVTLGASAAGDLALGNGAGPDGQRLTLVFVAVDAASTLALTPGVGNLDLESSLVPLAGDAMDMLYDSSTSTWRELSRRRPPGRLLGPPVVLTSGTTYTAPAGCQRIRVRVQAGGGGGGGANTLAASSAAGGGGAAGGFSEKTFTVVPGTNYTYAIGAGGAAGAAAGGNGGVGGNSTFSDGVTTVTALGGNGGIGMTPAAATPLIVLGGNRPGQSTNGDVNDSGPGGEIGLRLSATIAHSGGGGSAQLGVGGPGRVTQGAGLQGLAGGLGGGGGGGGGCSINGGAAAAGAAGSDGIIVIEEYS